MMNRNVYDDWNADGTLPEMKSCPFCRGKAILCDNGYERPVIDPETGAYIDMDMFDGDVFWCECPECGAESGYADDPKKAIALWNRRDNPPNAPLTLDKLREMDGEPVFATKNGKSMGYALVYFPCSTVYITFATGSKWDAEDLIDEGGKFYRRKPDEKMV